MTITWINLPKLESGNWWVVSLSLSWPMSFSILFSALSCWGRTCYERIACGVSGRHPRLIHHNIYLANLFAKSNLSIDDTTLPGSLWNQYSLKKRGFSRRQIWEAKFSSRAPGSSVLSVQHPQLHCQPSCSFLPPWHHHGPGASICWAA